MTARLRGWVVTTRVPLVLEPEDVVEVLAACRGREPAAQGLHVLATLVGGELPEGPRFIVQSRGVPRGPLGVVVVYRRAEVGRCEVQRTVASIASVDAFRALTNPPTVCLACFRSWGEHRRTEDGSLVTLTCPVTP